MVRSKDIDDVGAAGEAVGQVLVVAFRSEVGLLEAGRSLPGRRGDGSAVQNRVEVTGRPRGRNAVLGLVDPDHQASDEDPGQSVQQPGHLMRQAPKGGLLVADRRDPDRFVHALIPPRSLSPTC